MSMLSKLDQWLIDRPFQGLVDLMQKDRAWWVEQCAYAVLITSVGSAMFRVEPAYVLLFGNLLVAACFVLSSRMPAALELMGGRKNVRLAMLVLAVLTAPLLLKHGSAVFWMEMLNGLAFTSVYYFAACKPPKPREPRRKMARAT